MYNLLQIKAGCMDQTESNLTLSDISDLLLCNNPPNKPQTRRRKSQNDKHTMLQCITLPAPAVLRYPCRDKLGNGAQLQLFFEFKKNDLCL